MSAYTTLFESQVLVHLRMFRGQAVILDSDPAWFLGVEPQTILTAVRTTPEAFPADFALRLTCAELVGLRQSSPCLTDVDLDSEQDRFAFTTHGTGMLLAVLRDEKFALAAIPVLRAFARFWDETGRASVAKPLVNRNS